MRSILFGAALASFAAPALACVNPGMDRVVYESFLSREKNLVANVPQPTSELQFTRSDGQPGTLQDYRGKPTLVTFWFPDCPQCRIDTPELDKMLEKHGERTDLNFVQIAIRGKDQRNRNFTSEEIQAFLDRRGLSNVDAHIDRGQKLFVDNCLVGTPTHLILDREGKMVELLFGAMPWSDESVDRMLNSIASKL